MHLLLLPIDDIRKFNLVAGPEGPTPLILKTTISHDPEPV
jgi:hypothetical protein